MFDQYSQLKESALEHLDKATAFARSLDRKAIAEQLEIGRRNLAESRYNIAIVGDMKRGKSTLLNTLLGQRDDHLSPVQAKVCTSAITQYLSREAHAEGKSEGVVFLDNTVKPLRIPVESLRDYVTEERNPENSKGVRSVDVYGDFPLLHNVVTLVDTPGRGAVHRNHEILLEQFMPMADAIIVLIAADIPITAGEKEFLKQLSTQEKERVFFVLTKRDEVEDKDINEVRKWVYDQIQDTGLACDQLFEVSAKQVFDARKNGEDEATVDHLRQQSGVAALEAELESFIISSSAKNSSMLPRLRSLLEYVGQFCEQAGTEMEESLALMSMDGDSLREEIQQLKTGSDDLSEACERSLRKFKSAWSKSVGQFRTKIEGRSDPIADRILNKIQRGGLITAASGAIKARDLIRKEIANELQSHLPDLDQKLAEHVRQLSNDIESDWDTYQRSKVQSDFVLPTASLLGLGGTAFALANGFSQTMAAVSAWSTVGGASASQGLWGAISAYVVGGGTVATTTQAAIAATTPAVFAIGAAFAASWAAKTIIAAVQENRVPALVSETISTMAGEIAQKMEDRGQEIAATYRSIIEERVEANKERLCEIEQSLKSEDPATKASITKQLEESRTLLKERHDLQHSLSLYLTLPAPEHV